MVDLPDSAESVVAEMRRNGTFSSAQQLPWALCIHLLADFGLPILVSRWRCLDLTSRWTCENFREDRLTNAIHKYSTRFLTDGFGREWSQVLVTAPVDSNEILFRDSILLSWGSSDQINTKTTALHVKDLIFVDLCLEVDEILQKLEFPLFSRGNSSRLYKVEAADTRRKIVPSRWSRVSSKAIKDAPNLKPSESSEAFRSSAWIGGKCPKLNSTLLSWLLRLLTRGWPNFRRASAASSFALCPRESWVSPLLIRSAYELPKTLPIEEYWI